MSNKKKGFFHDYGLSITLFLLFLGSWILHAFFNWKLYIEEAMEHGQRPEVSGFLLDFGTRTFENWQSEFLQLFAMVTLTACLIHKGSHESKDTDEKFEASLNRIEARLAEMEKRLPTP